MGGRAATSAGDGMSVDIAERGPSALAQWAQAAQDAYQVAVKLAETPFVPKAMQGRPFDVTAAILTGRELGLSPMAALRSINIIDGTPAITAAGLRALALAHGHRVWIDESTETRAVVCGQRAGQAHVERVSWTMDRARKAGLASKRNWQNYPEQMLIARATSEVVRRIAADVIVGMPHSVEELGDGPDAPPDATPAAPARRTRTAQRAALPPVEAPALPPADDDWPPVEAPPDRTPPDEVVPYEPPPHEPTPEVDNEPAAPDPDLISDPQRRRMHAAFRDAGIADRDERLEFASSVVGRPLASSADLTREEAGRVIDTIDRYAVSRAVEQFEAGGLVTSPVVEP